MQLGLLILPDSVICYVGLILFSGLVAESLGAILYASVKMGSFQEGFNLLMDEK